MSKLVYFFWYGGSSTLLEPLIPVIKELGLKLITIHEWDNADVKWNLLTWLTELKKADIIILPANYEEQPCKSNNRLTQALSLGKPVVCSPLDAYIRVYDEMPGCCIIAHNINEWKESLQLLSSNDELCKQISEKALLASQKYSITNIAKKWINVFEKQSTLDIIIPTYNNIQYLKLCLDSIKRNSQKINKIIVSDAGSDKETWDFYKSLDVEILGFQQQRLNFSQACNAGIEKSTADYFVLLNSDTIVSKNWDVNLLQKLSADSNLAACGVLSNCDRFWLHGIPGKPVYSMSIPGLELVPGMKASQLEGKLESLYSFMESSNRTHQGTLVEQEWVAFYATAFNRKIINKVGLLDPNFINGCEDYCHCVRIKKMGYKIAQAIDSFVFHFGGVTRGSYENESKEVYHKEDQKNHLYLKEKYDKKTIAIFSGPSWEKWNYNACETGIGGSETWVIKISEEFVKLGFRVLNFCDCSIEGKFNGVDWYHYSKLHDFVEYNFFDYFIASRTTDVFRLPIRAGKKFVIIHDIWLSNQNYVEHQEKVDKFLVLSEWHKDFVHKHHNIPLEKLIMTSNGVNLQRFEKQVERQPYRLMYSSSLDRGLDTLLYLFDFIKINIPELELHIFYGLENWEKSAQFRHGEKEKIEAIKKAMDKPGVFYHGRIGQEKLAEEWLKSSLWAYPTDFEETNCITAIEAQAAGLPVLASNYAGLRTTVGDSGILVGSGQKNEAHTRDFRIEFASKCIELLRNKELWQIWSNKSLENAKKYSWANIAKQWVQEILC